MSAVHGPQAPFMHDRIPLAHTPFPAVHVSVVLARQSQASFSVPTAPTHSVDHLPPMHVCVPLWQTPPSFPHSRVALATHSQVADIASHPLAGAFAVARAPAEPIVGTIVGTIVGGLVAAPAPPAAASGLTVRARAGSPPVPACDSSCGAAASFPLLVLSCGVIDMELSFDDDGAVHRLPCSSVPFGHSVWHPTVQIATASAMHNRWRGDERPRMIERIHSPDGPCPSRLYHARSVCARRVFRFRGVPASGWLAVQTFRHAM